MSAEWAYVLGVVTPFAVSLLVATALGIIGWFTSTSSAYGCGTCGRWWGPKYDSSRSWIAGVRRDWHMMTAHPGERGRSLVAAWRGVPFPLDRRLRRMFPDPPITVWDVIARIPFLQGIAFGIAQRHGKARS